MSGHKQLVRLFGHHDHNLYIGIIFEKQHEGLK